MASDDGSKRALREAAEWHVRLNARNVGQDDLEAFFAWRRTPCNARAYVEIDKLWSSSEALGNRRNVAQAVHAALARPHWRRRLMRIEDRLRHPSFASVFAVILLICVGMAVSVLHMRANNVYETATGEQRIIPLADGSVVQLDSATHLRVRFTAHARRIDLAGGRALFSVFHDPDRPFIVHVGQADIRAVGTRFDVDAASFSAPEVVLVQGRLALGREGEDNQSVLNAGYATRFGAGGWSAPHRVDAEAATSWTTGRLRFQATPLADAIAEINRYTDHPLVLASARNGDILVSGSFDAHDTQGFADALHALYGLQASKQDDGSIQLR